MGYWCGMDWGWRQHAVCVVDEWGKKVLELVVPHSRQGLKELVDRLAELDPAMPVAIERPDGLVVDILMAAGHPVVPIPPHVLKACRPRYHVSGARNDPADAFLAADVLRTDGHRFAPLRAESDELRALRALSRMRSDLVAQRVALANQLRSSLDAFWPGIVGLFYELDSKISLSFLEAFSTPDQVHDVDTIARFLHEHRYAGRVTPARLWDRLQAAPLPSLGEHELRARAHMVQALVAVLRSLVDQIQQLTRDIEAQVGRLPTGALLMSFPRAGKVTAAQLLAELGEDPRRFASADHLACHAGVVPVTSASGKTHNVRFRLACNHRLRRAVTCLADNSRHESAWARYVYRNARRRGCSHPHAIRILTRAWIDVLWACWRRMTHYDPRLHRAAQPFLAAPSPGTG